MRLGTADVLVRAKTDGLKKDFNRAEKYTKDTASKMQKSLSAIKFKAILAGGIAFYGLAKAVNASFDAIQGWVTLAGIQETAEADLAAVVEATGKAAGFTAEELNKMASGLQTVTTVGDETIIGGMAILATFKNIRGEAFERTTKAALDMSQVMKQDLKTSMVMLGKALNDPISQMSALGRAGVSFTETQKEQIKVLWESGDRLGAQAVLLNELESEFGGAAEAARDTFGGAVIAAGNALGDTREELGFVITKSQAFIDIAKLAEQQFISLSKYIAENREEIAKLVKDGIVFLIDKVVWVLKKLKLLSDAFAKVKIIAALALTTISNGAYALAKAVRFLLLPIDLFIKALVWLGAVESNPFDALESSITKTKEAALGYAVDVANKNDKLGGTYDNLINKAGKLKAAVEGSGREYGGHSADMGRHSTDMGSHKGYAIGTGTRGLPETGWFFGHKGEIVKNPAESDRERRDISNSNTYNITIAPQFMSGDRAAARNVAAEIQRELDALAVRRG